MEERENAPLNDCQESGWKVLALSRKEIHDWVEASAEAIMPTDNSATLGGDIGKGGRANLRMERKKMARGQYQNGCLFVRGKRRKVWVARWREDVILANGCASRVMRSVVLDL